MLIQVKPDSIVQLDASARTRSYDGDNILLASNHRSILIPSFCSARWVLSWPLGLRVMELNGAIVIGDSGDFSIAS